MALTEQEKEAIKKERREYLREWRKKNPEKVKAANERFYLKRAAEHESITGAKENEH